LLVGSCASAPQVKVAAEVFDSEEAKNRSVAVIADLYMEDPVEADKLAGLIRDQLIANGFKVQETESEAELVIISTIERSKPTNAAAPPLPRLRRSFDVAYDLGQSSLMESQNGLRRLGFEFGSFSAPEQLKIRLMVSAVTREDWFKALLDQQTEVPRVWRIIAVSPLEKKDVTPKLVEAVGSKLNEVAAGPTPVSEKPQPTPIRSPKKKPTP
jgi:hypothetical protein